MKRAGQGAEACCSHRNKQGGRCQIVSSFCSWEKVRSASGSLI